MLSRICDKVVVNSWVSPPISEYVTLTVTSQGPETIRVASMRGTGSNRTSYSAESSSRLNVMDITPVITVPNATGLSVGPL